MLTQDHLKSLIDYNPETGEITKKPQKLKYRDADGYALVTIGGKRYYAHRLAHLYMTGKMPNTIDHINRVRHDNRWDNLRNGTQAQNLQNLSRRTDNTSGLAGVCWDKGRNQWLVRMGSKVIGRRVDFFEACCLRISRENKDGWLTNQPHLLPQ